MGEHIVRNASLVPDREVSAPQAGAELAIARERLGRTLAEMSALLRIRIPYLEALEQGRIETLPGRAYVLAFLRTYATALGLDADEAVRRFKAEAAMIGDKPALEFPAPLPERGLPTGALLLLGLVLVVGAYAGWYRLSGEGRLPAETVQPVPARLASLVPPPAPSLPTTASVSSAPASAAQAPTGLAAAPASTAGGAAPAQATPGSTAGAGGASPAAEASTSAGAGVAGTPSPAAPTAGGQPVAAAQAPSSTPAGATGPAPGQAPLAAFLASPVPNVPAGSAAAATPTPAQDAAMLTPRGVGASGLLVLATADSWVQVRSSAGAVVFSRLLHAGESWPVPAGRHLSLTTGNAGGTELVSNGVASPPLGAPGAVVRNLPLAPASTVSAAAASASAAPALAASAPLTTASAGPAGRD